MRQFAALGIALAFGPWSLWIEPRSVRVRRFDCPLPGLSGPLKIVAIGDLHPWRHHWSARRLRRAFALAQAERPDIVVWLGDYYNWPTGVLGDVLDRLPPLRRLYHALQVPMSEIADEMGRLTAPMGAYAILGNHDWAWSGETVAAELRRVGVTPLIGERAEVTHRRTGERLSLIGLDDATAERPTGWSRLREGAESPAILLSHAPDVWDQIEDAPALTLAGHSHGGQIAPRLLGATRLPEWGKVFVRGWFQRDGRRMYVTTGLGTSGLPIRYGAPPEIVTIRLQPA